MGSFLLTRVRFSSLNRCGELKQKDCLNELFDNMQLADDRIRFNHHETILQIFSSEPLFKAVKGARCVTLRRGFPQGPPRQNLTI